MSKISTTITLNDEVSSKLTSIVNSLDRFTNSFEKLEKNFEQFTKHAMMMQKNINLSNNSLNSMRQFSNSTSQSLNNTANSAQKLADNLLNAKRNAESFKMPAINNTIVSDKKSTSFKQPVINTPKIIPTKIDTNLKLLNNATIKNIKFKVNDKDVVKSANKINRLLLKTEEIMNGAFGGSISDTNKLLENCKKITKEAEKLKKNIRGKLDNISGKTPKLDTPDLPNPDFLNSFMGNFMGNSLANFFQRAMAGLKDLGIKALDTASSIIEVANVTETVFGKDLSQGEFDKWAKSTIDNFGITEIQAKKWAGTMGSIMSDAIDDKGALMKMSMDLAQLAGDLASFDNLNPEDAFYKLRSAMVGETEPIKDLGINMTVASLQAFALEKGIKKTTREMSNAELTMLRYNYLMEKTAFKQGDYTKTSNEYANRLRTMQGRFESLTAQIARGFLPILSSLFSVLIKLMKAIEPVVSGISDFIVKISEWAKESSDLKGVLISLGSIVTGFAVLSLGILSAKLIEVVKNKTKWIITTITTSKVMDNMFTQISLSVGVFSALAFALNGLDWAGKLLIITTLILIAVWSAFNKTLMLNPIIFIIGAIVMLVVWLINLWNTSEEFRKSLIVGWAFIVAYFQTVWALIVAGVSMTVAWVVYIWEWCTTELSLGIKWLAIQFHNAWNGIQAGVYDMGANILQGIQDTVNGVIKMVNKMIGNINKIFNISIKTVGEVSFSAIGKLRQKAQDRKNEINKRNEDFNKESEQIRNDRDNKFKEEMNKIETQLKDSLTNSWGGFLETLINSDKLAQNAPLIFPEIFGGGTGQGGDKNFDPEELFNKYGLDKIPELPSGVGGNKGSGGGKGGKLPSKLDRVDTVGKIEDALEIEDIEILLELSRDRYRNEYKEITPNLSIVINEAGGEIDKNELAQTISDMMVESIAKSMV